MTATPKAPSQRGRLFRKYLVVFVALVSSALLASGLIELLFSFREHQEGLLRTQRAQAAVAAAKIDGFLREMQQQVRSAIPPPAIENVPLEQRRADYRRLQRLYPALTEVSYLDPTGRECVRVSSIVLDVVGCDRGGDQSREPKFLETRSGKPYFGAVYFRGGSEPYLSLAIPEGASGGVTTAEVNLKFILEVIEPIKIGRAGHAYVVDAAGNLIAHPDISLVLRKTDLSALPQVQAARAYRAGEERAMTAQDAQGRSVLTAFERIDPPGWAVFVEQPLDEALAPLYASVLRTAVLLLAGLALSAAASFVLARRMTEPIRTLQAGAARIGAGSLEQRIEIRSGDELEALADEFNRMTERLRESYATLEGKVEERTSELSESRRQLEAASRHKSDFLANMSHELRTPLNAIIGFTEVVLDRMFGDLNAKQAEYLNDALDSAKHLLSLINDILDLSKIEAGRMELDLAAFSLREALQAGLVMVRERAARHGIHLALELEPDLDLVEADERKVRQIIFNLLSNAVKYTPDGGRVTLRAAVRDAEVEVSVADTGVGIAPEDQAQIFEEFQQTKAARGREGTGLGLTLTKKYVELHGGRIWVESEPGKGSAFTFALPLKPQSESRSSAAPALAS